MIKKKKSLYSSIICTNKRVQHEFFIIEEFKAGLVLQGWEVKSLRAGKVDIVNSYISLKEGEAFLFDAKFIPLINVSKQYSYNPTRVRKLLLKQHELDSLYGYTNRKSYTITNLALFWKNSWCKIKIGIVKGKKQYDKRHSLKEREWRLDKSSFLRDKEYYLK